MSMWWLDQPEKLKIEGKLFFLPNRGMENVARGMYQASLKKNTQKWPTTPLLKFYWLKKKKKKKFYWLELSLMTSLTSTGDWKMQSLFWEPMALAKMSRVLEEVDSSYKRFTSTLYHSLSHEQFILSELLIFTRIVFLKQIDWCSSAALKPVTLHFE